MEERATKISKEAKHRKVLASLKPVGLFFQFSILCNLCYNLIERFHFHSIDHA